MFQEYKGRKWECADETASEYEMGDFLYGLVRILKPSLIVETGTYHGTSTKSLAHAIQDNGFGKVITCEPNKEFLETAWQYCGGDILARPLPLPIEFRNCMSIEVPELEQADMIFSDSDYKYRLEEIARAKPGCVIVVHDTRISYDGNIPPLEGAVRAMGGIAFDTYRGFGIILKGSSLAQP